MRWLVVHPGPQYSVHDVYVGWVEALRELGQHVIPFNLDDRLALYTHALIDIGDPGPHGELKLRKALTNDQAVELAVNGVYAALYKTRPDILLVISGFLVPTDLMDLARRSGTRVVLACTEQPYELERELDLAAHVDLALVNDPMHMERFSEVAPTVYCPQAYREGLHHSGEPDPELIVDLAFVGTGFPSRRWFFERMNLEGLDVLLAGNWNGVTEDSPLRKYLASGDPQICCDNADTARIYQSAKVGMNLYRREAEDDQVVGGWAVGPRELEMAACGMFFLRDPRPEGDSLFHMLPVFSSPEEASWLLRYWLDHPEERHKAAQQACEAIQDRTFTQNARSLLRLLEKKE